MKLNNSKMRTNFAIQENKDIKSATNRIKKILDAKYEKANLKEMTNKSKYSNKYEQLIIYRLFKKHENRFDGTKGNYTGTEYEFELLLEAQPYHAKPFPIPKIHEETPKTEVNRLVKIGVLKCKNNSEWVAPTFILKDLRGNCFLFLKYSVHS